MIFTSVWPLGMKKLKNREWSENGNSRCFVYGWYLQSWVFCFLFFIECRLQTTASHWNGELCWLVAAVFGPDEGDVHRYTSGYKNVTTKNVICNLSLHTEFSVRVSCQFSHFSHCRRTEKWKTLEVSLSQMFINRNVSVKWIYTLVSLQQHFNPPPHLLLLMCDLSACQTVA